MDAHAHIYSKKFLKRLEERAHYPFFRAGNDGGGTIYLKEGVKNVIPFSFVDMDFRIKEMKHFGISTELVSATNPWTDTFPSAELAIEFSKLANDEIASLVSRYGSQFVGLATIPLLDPQEAAQELTRSVTELGLYGAIIGTNVNGTYLSDKTFLPIFQAASKLGRMCILFLHPSSFPIGAERLKDGGLIRTLGFPFDTTVCLVKMAYSGLFDSFPNLKILAAHLGGALPYLQGRIDVAWDRFEDSKGSITEVPTSKIKRVLYTDSISYNAGALRLASEVLGVDRLIFGSDFPFEWGVKTARESVEECFKTEGDLSRIYHENFERMIAK